MNTHAENMSASGRLVTFQVGAEIYGIDIFKIKEVLHLQEITVIPNAPRFVEGVIQVRDRVIPLVDLKRRLNIPDDGAEKKRIVILDLDERPLGVIVDDISKVLMLDDSCFEPVPEAVVDDYANGCISMLAKQNGDLIIVLAPEKILSRDERMALDDMEAAMENNEVFDEGER